MVSELAINSDDSISNLVEYTFLHCKIVLKGRKNEKEAGKVRNLFGRDQSFWTSFLC